MFIDAIDRRLQQAYATHGCEPWGRHEFYGVLKEEVDELWDAIKADEPMEAVFDEMLDVAVVLVRYVECGDRYRDDDGVLAALRFVTQPKPRLGSPMATEGSGTSDLRSTMAVHTDRESQHDIR
jgi:NTP pyrophosphatase (non-canonical NTP hydrolase)